MCEEMEKGFSGGWRRSLCEGSHCFEVGLGIEECEGGSWRVLIIR